MSMAQTGTANITDFNPSSIEEWVANLPRASAGTCAQNIYQLLKVTNSQKMRAQERFQMLEAIREPIQYVRKLMEKHYINSDMPLPEKSLRIAQVNKALHLKMSIAYMMIFEEESKRSTLFSDKKRMTRVIHRAMTYMGLAQLISYQYYTPEPDELWIHLYKLYTYASGKKLHNTPIKDEFNQVVKKTSIQDEFSRIALLSQASPFHLYQGEIDTIYYKLEQWLGLLEIYRRETIKNQIIEFIVNLDETLPPSHIALSPGANASNNVLLVSTSKLVEQLSKEMEGANENFSDTIIRTKRGQGYLSKDLLKRLKANWSKVSVRAYKRKEKNCSLVFSIGLSMTHELVLKEAYQQNGQVKIDSNTDSQLIKLIDTQSTYSAKQVKSASDKQPDVWEMVYQGGKLELYSENQISENSPMNEKSTEIHLSDDNWTLVNDSAGGYCVSCDEGCGNNLHVGEIVGLKIDQNTPGAWVVGSIKWIKSFTDTGISVGGDFLGANAIPVATTTRITPEGHYQNLQRALLIPAIKPIKKPSTLIAGANLYRSGYVIDIHLKNTVIQVRLTEKSRTSDFYDEFEFEQVQTSGRETQQDDSIDNVGFDHVWTSF
ncbi:MAG: hypothetical protein OQK73_12815 [Gammaproteobacteria bacterium]|nr:hypothetical protein [Gammaproteobacteria bacterium]